jgi:hypothetical protein
MIFTLTAVLIALVALFVIYLAARLLWQKSWFLGFIRGSLGVGLLLIGVIIALTAVDIYSYKQILQEQVVATISFKEEAKQRYLAFITDKAGKEQSLEILGDQWQLDARIVKWKGYLASFSIKPAYRLDRLSGRYYDIEQETKAGRSVHNVSASLYGVDAWKIANKYPSWLPIIDAVYGSATYLPMKDGAIFEVTLSNTGLLARPVNAVAREAVDAF